MSLKGPMTVSKRTNVSAVMPVTIVPVAKHFKTDISQESQENRAVAGNRSTRL